MCKPVTGWDLECFLWNTFKILFLAIHSQYYYIPTTVFSLIEAAGPKRGLGGLLYSQMHWFSEYMWDRDNRMSHLLRIYMQNVHTYIRHNMMMSLKIPLILRNAFMACIRAGFASEYEVKCSLIKINISYLDIIIYSDWEIGGTSIRENMVCYNWSTIRFPVITRTIVQPPEILFWALIVI